MEKPNASLPWPLLQKLLNPLERLTTNDGYLLAPTTSQTLVALFHALEELQSEEKSSLRLSLKNFKAIHFLDENRLAVGVGCEWKDVQQSLYEQGLEIEGYQENIFPLNVSIEELVKNQCLKCLGAELVSYQGEQFQWGSSFITPALGPQLGSLDELIKNYLSVAITIFLKTRKLPIQRLSLLWEFAKSQEAKEHWQSLKICTTSWEQLIFIQSGHSTEKHFVFGQMSGYQEEMDYFSTICPKFSQQIQSPSFAQIKSYLRHNDLKIYPKLMNDKLKIGEYFWQTENIIWFLKNNIK